MGRVKGQRLIVFCSEIETDLDRVREALAEATEQPLENSSVAQAEPPDGMADAGWMAVSVQLSEAVRAGEALSTQLETVTGLFSRVLKESVLGVVVDPAEATARACYHSPGMFPRSTEGESFHVIRQAAGWIETDPNALVRYFDAHAQRNELVQRVDLSDISRTSAEEEPAQAALPDDEDRYVDAKLKHARELMQRYLGNRK